MGKEIPNKWSCIKRDFVGAPIYRALQSLKEKKSTNANNCQIDFRPHESYWIRADGDKVIVLYNIHFDDEIDQTLAKTMLGELIESNKAVK